MSTNPFDAFNISDDQETGFQQEGKQSDKVRKTHKERRELKKQVDTPVATTQVAQELTTRVKEDAKAIRHNRNGRPQKEVTEGHTLDRRSGTGRVDRPRKEGGGRGNIGNVHDELNKEKYQTPAVQVAVEQVVQQTKPEEPQAPTLAEYYQSKGITLNQTVAPKKVAVRPEVNAEWIKKEKLIVLETKEDKKRTEVVKQTVLQQNNTRVQRDLEGKDYLGFGSKPSQKPREQVVQEQPRNNTRGAHQQKGGKSSKVTLKEEDFPSL